MGKEVLVFINYKFQVPSSLLIVLILKLYTAN